MAEEHTTPEFIDSEDLPKGGRWRRRIFWSLGCLVGGLILVGLLGPTVLSTSLGNRWILSIVNDSIPGTVHADSIDLAWFSGQKIERLRLNDPDGAQVLEVKSIEASDVSLWSLLRGSRNLGKVRVVDAVGMIDQLADGSTTLTKALVGAKSGADRDAGIGGGPHRSSGVLKNLYVKLELVDARLTYRPINVSPVELVGLSVTADMAGIKRVSATLKTQIRQGHTHGEINADITAKGLFNDQGVLTPSKAEVDVDLSLSNMPVVAADRLLHQEGRLAALLGPTLNARAIAKGNLNQLSVTIWANTQHLKALIGLESDPARVVLNPESVIRLRVTPQGWEALNRFDGKTSAMPLTKPFNIKLDVKEFVAKRSGVRVNANDAKGEVELHIGDIILDSADPGIGRVAIRGTQAKFEFNGPENTVDISIQSVAEQAGQPGKIDLAISAVAPLNAQGGFNHDGMYATITGSAERVPMGVLDRFFGAGGLIPEVVGSTLDARIEGKIEPKSGEQLAKGAFTLTASADHLDVSLRGELVGTDLVIEPHSEVTIRVQRGLLPLLVEKLEGSFTEAPMLVLSQVATVRVMVEKLMIGLETPSDPRVEMSLRGSIDKISPSGDPRFEGVAIQDVKVVVSGTSVDQSISVSLGALLGYHDKTATLRGSLNVAGYGGDSQTIEGRALIEAVPVGMINALTGGDMEYALWLGERIDKIAIQVDADPGQALTITGHIGSEWLNSSVAGSYSLQDRLLKLRKGSWVEYRMVPAVFDALTSQRSRESSRSKSPISELILSKPMVVKAFVQEAQVRLTSATKDDSGLGIPEETRAWFDPTSLKLSVHLLSDGAAVRWRDTRRVVQLEELSAALRTEDASQDIDLLFKLGFKESGGSVAEPSVNRIISRTRITGLFDASGRSDLARASIHSNTKAEGFPAELVDEFLGWDGLLTGILGSDATVVLQGRVEPGEPGTVELNADSGTTELHAGVVFGESIKLRDDVSVALRVTPELSERWLKRIHPLLSDAVVSKEPIRLRVYREGFEIPLEGGLAVRRVKAEAELDIGTLRFRNNGFINNLRKIFKRDTSRYPIASFTPMKIRVSDGVVSYQDMTMRMDNLVLGFRGRIDQVNNRVDMLMSISGQTMAKAFGLRGVVGPDYQFDVPIRGTIGHPEIDLGAIAGEAARLAIQSEIKKHLGGSIEGEAAGEILDLFLRGQKKKE